MQALQSRPPHHTALGWRGSRSQCSRRGLAVRCSKASTSTQQTDEVAVSRVSNSGGSRKAFSQVCWRQQCFQDPLAVALVRQTSPLLVAAACEAPVLQHALEIAAQPLAAVLLLLHLLTGLLQDRRHPGVSSAADNSRGARLCPLPSLPTAPESRGHCAAEAALLAGPNLDRHRCGVSQLLCGDARCCTCWCAADVQLGRAARHAGRVSEVERGGAEQRVMQLGTSCFEGVIGVVN
jgi:hypothetical protein